MPEITLIVTGARQLLTLAPAPGGAAKRGAEMSELGILEDGALAISGDRIVAVGTSAEIGARYRLGEGGVRIDAQDCVVLPAFVDPHTHLIWAGDRAAEFEMRLQGKTYLLGIISRII